MRRRSEIGLVVSAIALCSIAMCGRWQGALITKREAVSVNLSQRYMEAAGTYSTECSAESVAIVALNKFALFDPATRQVGATVDRTIGIEWHAFVRGQLSHEVKGVFHGIIVPFYVLDLAQLVYWHRVRFALEHSYTGQFVLEDRALTPPEQLVRCTFINSTDADNCFHAFEVDPCGKYVAFEEWQFREEYRWIIARGK